MISETTVPAPSGDRPPLDLAQTLVARSEQQYQQYVEQWHRLDVKAQGLTAVAGILLTGLWAVIALIARGGYTLHWIEKSVLTLSMLLLLSVVVQSLRCLRVRETIAGYPVVQQGRLICNAAAYYPGDEDAMARVFIDHILPGWIRSNDEMRDLLYKKARPLKCGQYLLVSAIIIFGPIVLNEIWRLV